MAKPWLIGENNPYGADPDYALYPWPRNCSGWRLCHRVLELSDNDYLNRYERRNLLQAPKWSVPAARVAADKLIEEIAGAPLVLLGARVAKAFRLPYLPFHVAPLIGLRVISGAVVLPHPSGLSRAWNEPGAFERARVVLRKIGAL